jgi:hypothetical protein
LCQRRATCICRSAKIPRLGFHQNATPELVGFMLTVHFSHQQY